MNTYELLQRSAEQWAHEPAVIDRHGRVDYRTLCEQVEDVKGQLQRQGVEPGHGVGVMAPNGRSFIIGAFAVASCGATVLPMSPTLRQAELETFFRDVRVHAIIGQGFAFRPEAGQSSPVHVPGAMTMPFTWTGASRDRPCVEIVPDAAFVRLTSGTIGQAKGVVLSHRSVIERTAAANRVLGLTCGETIIWVLPMAFHFFVSIVLYLQVGATIVVCADHLAETILEDANRYGGTFLYAAPLHYRLLVGEASGARFQTLRRALSTAVALPQDVAYGFRERFGLPISQAYGIIEVGLPLINLERPEEKPDSVGRPLPDYEVAILDSNLSPVPTGEIGQLALRGPGMFEAYLSPPSKREEVLRDGWFLSGDMAWQDREGFVTIVGRCKSMINVGGNKVFPEEVEHVLNTHAAVRACRVSAREHHQLGEVVHADVVLADPRQPVDAEKLVAFCHRLLASFKVPNSIAFVSEIAQTDSGKIRRY